MIKMKVTGGKTFQDYLKAVSAAVDRDLESLASQAARVAGVELARSTLPLGFAEPVALRSRIQKGIDHIWIADEDILAGNKASISRAYTAVEAKWGKGLAARFWKLAKASKFAEACTFLRKYKIRRRVTRREHDAYRTGPKGTIPRTVAAVAVGQQSARDSLSKQQQAKAGLAKAGWVAAALSLGGRLRYRRAETGETGEKIPPFLRKLSKIQGIGSSSLVRRQSTVQVTITNHVRHIRDATNQSLNEGAVRTAQDHFRKAIHFSMQWHLKKLRRSMLSRAA